MPIIMKMKNPLFDAESLYIMLRLAALESFPYPATHCEADILLSTYMKKKMNVDFTVENKESESGLVFSGEVYARYKDIKLTGDKSEYGNDRSPVWYVQKIMQWNKEDLSFLYDDINQMKTWLRENDYLKTDRPTEKFLREKLLVIDREK